ncbi:MAG: DUF4272 domain-containing protein [Treponema sp.]|nr:DUF4272 domain-containing protein [Treponema sp.]
MASKDLECVERREKTKKILSSKNIPIDESTALTETVKPAKDFDSMCKRAIASLLVIQLASSFYEGDRDSDNIEIIKRYLSMLDVEKSLLTLEKKMLEGKLTKEQLLSVTWKYEAYWSLVWSLGLIEDIADASKTCDFNTAISLVRDCLEYDEFKSKCKMRPESEILEMKDLYFCYYKAICAAGDEQEVRKLKLNPDVVKERLKGLEWIFSKQKDWFEITLD